MFRFLFRPHRFRSCTLRNRIICGPMEKNLCTEFGLATGRYGDYVEERAKGGAGLIMLESAYVEWAGKARRFQMGIHEDTTILPLRRVVDRAHRHGAAVGMQLHHGGRTCQQAITGIRPIAPSPLPCNVLAGGDIPEEMTEEGIQRVLAAFRKAALRCLEAGVDVIEIHGAHGYLVGQFLSPFSNFRKDQYGGSFENRCRFPFEVIRSVRETVGIETPVFYRISGDEFVDGGLGLEETTRFAKLLEEREVDLVNVSAGVYESGVMIVQPMEFALGGYVPMARAFKEAILIPVSIAGRICDPYQAESILAEGSADFVTMTRAFHADPHWPKKALEGRFHDICLCIGCNQGCTDRLRENVPLSCILNTRAGFEREFRPRPAPKHKNVWVVGGGPAGLTASRVCALRGHRVTLFEQEGEPGGLARFMRRIEHKAGFWAGIRFLFDQAHREGVDFRLGFRFQTSMIGGVPPDAIILATGSKLIRPPQLEQGELRVFDFSEALVTPGALGGQVVVFGGGLIGCETALYLAERGKRVTLVEPGGGLVQDLGPRARWYLEKRVKEHPLIETLFHARLERAERNALSVRRPEGVETIGGFDALVLSERAPDRSLLEEIENAGFAGELFIVGDCLEPAHITEATFEATRIGFSV